VGAGEIYAFDDAVAAFATTDVARAIVDLNRAEHDRRKDGVVKTHTCWDVPVYQAPLPTPIVETLLAKYHRPYHRRLAAAAEPAIRLAIDCHTMAAVGPPVAPDPGVERPWVCLGNADGTCPEEWVEGLKRCLEQVFGPRVTINEPFRGGYITRTHAAEMPWVQLELSRAPFATNTAKRDGVLSALRAWVEQVAEQGWPGPARVQGED
jgi:formiminoglutamase